MDNIQSWTELIVIISFSFSLLLGFYLSLLQVAVDRENKTYSLTFKDDLTTFNIGNGRLTLTTQNTQSNSHLLEFYGLNAISNGSNIRILKSDLSNKDGGIIDNSKINLNMSEIPTSNLVRNPQGVILSIDDSKEAGTFNGWLILSNGREMTSIPLKASTLTLLYIPIGWVVVGAAISIGLWEIIRYLNAKKSEAEEKKLEKEFEKLSKQVKKSRDEVKDLESRVEKLERLVEKAVSSAKDVEAFSERLKQITPQVKAARIDVDLSILEEKDYPRNDYSQHEREDLNSLILTATNAATGAINAADDMNKNTNHYAIETFLRSRDTAQKIIQSVTKVNKGAQLSKALLPIIKKKSRAEVDQKIEEQDNLQAVADVNRTAATAAKTKLVSARERVADSKQKSRIAIIDIASAGFGIAVAFLGILNNTFVTNLQIIGDIEILTLIGIGLGVGSLKEIVDRS